MAKWCGIIGYVESVEKTPGVWKDVITEKKYVGDVERNSSRWTTRTESTNDNLSINNQITIISDAFARLNFHHMKYVEFMGTKWKIDNVDVQYPRLILSLGGEYNG